jgi:hypothetical protein
MSWDQLFGEQERMVRRDGGCRNWKIGCQFRPNVPIVGSRFSLWRSTWAANNRALRRLSCFRRCGFSGLKVANWVCVKFPAQPQQRHAKSCFGRSRCTMRGARSIVLHAIPFPRLFAVWQLEARPKGAESRAGFRTHGAAGLRRWVNLIWSHYDSNESCWKAKDYTKCGMILYYYAKFNVNSEAEFGPENKCLASQALRAVISLVHLTPLHSHHEPCDCVIRGVRLEWHHFF